MAHSNTQFDKAQIDSTANRHTALADDVRQQLEALGGEIATTASASSSKMTAALMSVYETWKGQVNRTVLSNMTLMSDSMKAEANNQEIQDTENVSTMRQTEVGSYLGG